MREITYGEAVCEAIREEMRRDESVFLIGEDLRIFGGPYRILKGLADEFGPDRVIDTPIAEAAIAGAAIGAAMVGMRPIAEIFYVDWSTIAMDAMFNIAAKIRFMTGGVVRLPMVLRMPQGGGLSAGPQHSQSMEVLYAYMPGLIVVLPSTPYDAKGLLKSAIREDNPVVYIDTKFYHSVKGSVPEEEYIIPLGKADIKREGNDITVVALLRSVLHTLEAATTLEKEGINIEIVDPMTIKPLDEETIINSVKKTGRLVIVHEGHKSYGFGAEVAAMVAEKCMDYLEAPIKRIAALDVPVPFGMKLESQVLPNIDDIIEGIRGVVRQ